MFVDTPRSAFSLFFSFFFSMHLRQAGVRGVAPVLVLRLSGRGVPCGYMYDGMGICV